MKQKLLLLFVSFLSLTTVAQDTEFWFAPPMRHTSGTYVNGGGFVFSNPTHRQATVNIKYYKDNSDTTIYIPAYSYNYLHYPLEADLTAKIDVPYTIVGSTSVSAAVHITSNVGITGYYIYDWRAQQETFMLKGSASAGTKFTMTTGYAYNSWITGGSGRYGQVVGYPYIGITGTEDNTSVDFTIPSACIGFAAGSNSVILNKGQVLYLRSSSGRVAATSITSDKPVTVTGGETCRNSSGSAGSGGYCDQCGDQIVSDAYAGNTYVMPLSGGFRSYANYNRVNNYFELIALEPNTTVEIDWGNGLTPLVTLVNAGDIYISDTFKVNRVNSCATIIADKPVHIMQNTGVEATLCHLPNFYGTNTHQTSFYSYYESTSDNIYPSASLIYLEASKDDYMISYPRQTETPLFDWITANARWIDGEGDVPQFTGWKYIRFTLPDPALNQIITIKSQTSVFQLGFTSSFMAGTYLNYLTSFNAEFSFDPDTVWTCPGIYTNLIGGIASYYKWTYPDGSVKEGTDLNSVRAVQMGMYILEMTQGFTKITDTCWVNSINFSKNGTIGKSLSKPFKVNKPQQFIPSIDEEAAKHMTEFRWTFEGGTPSTSTDPSPTVVFKSTGVKEVTLYMKYETVYPDSTRAVCDSLLTIRVPVQPPTVDYYVNPSTPNKVGVNDSDKTDSELYNEGKSWEDPFNLEDALKQASQGDVVHIPEGVYTPSQGTSFVIDCDSVSIVGGFAGWESGEGELIPSVENTITRGKDGPAVIFELGSSVGACGITTATRIEGFTIEGGKAQYGGGILFKGGASGTVANCIIRNNTATEDGGGVYTVPYAGCGTSDDPIFYNVEISGNRAKRGAGMYNQSSSPTLTNVTIGGNGASVAGAGMYNENASPVIRNTIVYGNVTKGQPLGDEFTNSGGTPVISYSNISGCNGSGEYWDITLGTDAGKNIDKEPLYWESGYDFGNGTLKQGNYRISFHSPSRNKGYNAYVWNKILTDLAGYDRILYDIVDMGAYEYIQPENPEIRHEVKIRIYPHVTTDPVMGLHYVTSHENFMITFTPAAGYSLEHIQVTTGSAWQDGQGGMEVIHKEDGSVTVIFNKVMQPLDIQLTGVGPVTNELIDKIYTLHTTKDHLVVRTTKAGTIRIHNMTGKLIKQQDISEGETAIPLSQGIYVVSFNEGQQQKVIVK